MYPVNSYGEFSTFALVSEIKDSINQWLVWISLYGKQPRFGMTVIGVKIVRNFPRLENFTQRRM